MGVNQTELKLSDAEGDTVTLDRPHAEICAMNLPCVASYIEDEEEYDKYDNEWKEAPFGSCFCCEFETGGGEDEDEWLDEKEYREESSSRYSSSSYSSYYYSTASSAPPPPPVPELIRESK